MKFALIGSSVSVWPLLEELQGAGDAALIGSAISGPLLQLAAGRIALRQTDSVEDALLLPNIDTVILSLDDPEEILRLTLRGGAGGAPRGGDASASDCFPGFGF
ncbi:MAG UNVERIFIED_CONTAM: hypothetical protein LVR18_08175 [Planctomycetaceae bacterium]|jgi:hypothetical protein